MKKFYKKCDLETSCSSISIFKEFYKKRKSRYRLKPVLMVLQLHMHYNQLV